MKKTVFSKVLSIALTLAMMIACFPTFSVEATEAQTLTVDKTMTASATNFNTIQEAITAAKAGDTIKIDGTYTENVAVDNKSNLTITVAEGGTAEIDGSLTVNSSSGVTIQSLNVKAGDKADAITLNDCNNATVTQCNIIDSKIGIVSAGTVIGKTNRPVVNINRTKIKGCANAIYADKTINYITTNVLYNCTTGIVSNKVSGNMDYDHSSEFYIFNNTFYNITSYNIDVDQPSKVGGNEAATLMAIEVMNNVFSRPSVGQSEFIRLTTKTTGFYFEGNDFFNSMAGQKVEYTCWASATGASYTVVEAHADDDETTSTYADPKFKDAANGDFTLATGSPAITLGTKQSYSLANDMMGNAYTIASKKMDTGAYDSTLSTSDPESAFLKSSSWVAPTPVSLDTIYVAKDGKDTNDGSEAKPFATIGAAVKALKTGNDILVKKGEYDESITLTNLNASDKTADPIVIKNYGTDAVTIKAPTANTVLSVLAISGCTNVEISGFKIDGNNTTLTNNVGINTNGTTNYGCKIHDCTITNTGIPINFYSADSCEVYNNVLTNHINYGITLGDTIKCKVYNNIATGSKGLLGDYAFTGTIVTNNVFPASDIPRAKASAGTVQNNIFTGAVTVTEAGIADYNLYVGTAPANGGTNSKAVATLDDVKFTDATNGDYTLAEGSPAIAAGTKTNMSANDIAGVKRVNADLGAYVYTPPANSLPTFTLSKKSIDEKNKIGDIVGTFSEVNGTSTKNYTYSLATGGDNDSFKIEGKNLEANSVFVFNTKSSYAIQVMISDGAKTSQPLSLTITINDPRKALPTFTLDKQSVDENQAPGTVGTFTAVNPTAGKTYTYALTSDTDNASFTIDGNTLKSTVIFDYETKASYTVKVTVSDGTLISEPVSFKITVNNLDEALPTFLLSNRSIDENNKVDGTAVIGTFSESNPIYGKTYTYALTSDTDNASFVIVGKNLVATTSFNYEMKKSYKVYVTISDGSKTSSAYGFTITINDVSEPSTNPGGSSNTNNNNNNSNNNSNNSSTKKSSGIAIGYSGDSASDTVAESGAFSDIASHWAKSAILAVSSEGIISGYTDGTVKPDNNATRAEFTSMIVNMLKLKGNATSDFSDVDTDAWYAAAVSVAVSNGLVSGQGNGTFNPNSSITREEAMVMAANVLQRLNPSDKVDTTVLSKFADSNSISSWAQNAAATLVADGIISGSNGNLNPKASITRAEICVIINKIMTNYMDNGVKVGYGTHDQLMENCEVYREDRKSVV